MNGEINLAQLVGMQDGGEGNSLMSNLGKEGSSAEALNARVAEELGLTQILEEEANQDLLDNVDKEKLLGEFMGRGDELEAKNQQIGEMGNTLEAVLQQAMQQGMPEAPMGIGQAMPEAPMQQAMPEAPMQQAMPEAPMQQAMPEAPMGISQAMQQAPIGM